VRLSVLSVAYPLAPVSPDTAGGAEHVLAQLDRGLVRRGHESIVIAAEGSTVAGELFAIPARPGTLDDCARRSAWRGTRSLVEQVLRVRRVNLVHMHGIDFNQYMPATDVPVLVTLHLPPSWYPPESFEQRTNVYLHCVSESQHAACPPCERLLSPIPNGVALDEFRLRTRKRSYLFAMGRICPEKGFDKALDASLQSGFPLILAGQLFRYAEHERYFHEEIAPRLDDHTRRFIGSVGPERKRRLLAGARCVLIPSLAPETSSLVAMEALACGTPVIAFRSGALSSLINDGQTGFLVDSVGEMVSAIHKADSIAPRSCREYAEQHFDLERTIDCYLEVYNAL
jgi:glycosyltransferase involved in cell wall biosynthesis